MESLIVGNWLSSPEMMSHGSDPDDHERGWHPWMESTAFQSASSDAGIRVTRDVAYSHPPILDALLLIGGDCTLFLDLFKTEDAAQISDRNHDAFRLVSRAPNAMICPDVFWELMIQRAMIHGNSIAKIQRSPAGRPLSVANGGGMEPLPPRTTGVEHDEDGRLWITTRRGPNNEKEFIDPLDTLHIRSITTDGFWGRGILRDGRDTIGNGVALTRHSSATFKNSARPDFLFSFPGKVGQVALDEFRTVLHQKNKGVDKRGESLIVDAGMKATQLGMSLEDAQFKELVELDTVGVAQHFGIPPVMLGVTGQMTFSNTEEVNRWYINRTLRRWLGRITNEAAAKLLTIQERENMFFRHDLTPLLEGNIKDRMDAAAKGVASLIFNPNEARKRFGLNPRDGGDAFVNPNTTKGGTPDNREAAASLNRILSWEDNCVIRAAPQENFTRTIKELYKIDQGLCNRLTDLVPVSALEYCDNRFNWWLSVAGAVNSKASLADMIKAQRHTVRSRVAALLDQEFLNN